MFSKVPVILGFLNLPQSYYELFRRFTVISCELSFFFFFFWVVQHLFNQFEFPLFSTRGGLMHISKRGIQLSDDWQFQGYVISDSESTMLHTVLVKPVIRASIRGF